MTATVLPLADHPLVTAIPFFVPVVILTVGVLVLAIRERRRRQGEG